MISVGRMSLFVDAAENYIWFRGSRIATRFIMLWILGRDYPPSLFQTTLTASMGQFRPARGRANLIEPWY